MRTVSVLHTGTQMCTTFHVMPCLSTAEPFECILTGSQDSDLQRSCVSLFECIVVTKSLHGRGVHLFG